MITWLQTTFGKHHKTVFGLLLGVIILTFVLTFGPSGASMARSEMEVQKALFYGYNLTSRKEVEQLQNGAMLSGALNPKDTRILRQNREDYMLARTAGLGMANEYGVPTPTVAQIKSYIETRSAFQNEKGEFDQNLYSRFMDNIKASGGRFTEDSIMRTLIEDWRVEQIAKTIAGPGFVLPYEARLRLTEKQSVWSAVQASADFNAFKPEVTVDDVAARAFYDASPVRYEEPEKVKIKALEFPFSTYLPLVPEPAEPALRTYFAANTPRFTKPPAKPAEGETPAPPAPPVFEEVQPEVVVAFKEAEARKLAENAADAFSVKLFRDGITYKSDAFKKLVEAQGLTLTDYPAYAKNQPPFQIGFTDYQSYMQVLNAFNLDAENYHTDPIRTRTGAALIIFEEKITPYVPGYDEVKERVLTDAKEEERRKQFIENGNKLKATIELEMSTGKSFEEAAKAAGLTTQVFESFKGAEIPAELKNNGGFEQLLGLQEGQVSPMVFKETQGLFVYLKSKSIPEISKDSPDLVAELKSMNEELSTADGWVLLTELAAKEITRLNPPKDLLNN
ncbi:MAG: SurA N-terminal domain-containing protein [Verrucomicrobiota bacterium]|nr:SurA N-terminal domain-containing protein [Verrucomicrobiota bacterium]